MSTDNQSEYFNDGIDLNDYPLQSTEKTIPTTGATTFNFIAPFAAVISGIDFSGKDALATNNTNYLTFTGVNKGQAGAGSAALLAVSDANTTKATGGSAIVANGKRSLSLHGTSANLVVAAGDRVQIVLTATGTLANTVTEALCRVIFTRTA